MDFTMFLPGDSDFVLEVLQSVSAIMATGYLGTGAAFGGVLALIIAGVKHLTSGAAIGWRATLVTIGMFQAFFGTTQQVAVENMLTGETEIVDGIPTGVAVTGTVVTKTGWVLTELMEQGFSRPGMTQNGLFSDLQTLRAVRMMPYLVPTAGISDMVGSATVSMTKNWGNYYKSCVWPLSVQEDNSELRNTIRNSDNMLEGFDTKLANNMVLVNLPGGTVSLNCSDSYTQLRSMFEDTFYPTYLAANAVRFGLPEGTTFDVVQDKIERSIDNLRGWSFGGSNNARNLILNTVLYDMIYKSYREESIAALNDPWSTMMEDARRQRAAQWSGEAQLWTSVMPAAASFFIGMVYALTPLVAILLIMGDFGVKLVVKYIAVLLWVMMWPIVMSIVNLYGQVSTTSEFQSLIAEAGSLTSLNALDQIDAMLIDKMALLDKLVAAAATIALFLATGSMYAMTQLTGAFSSGDHIDEKKVAPDSYSSSPTLQTNPMFTADQTNGMRETGFDNVVGTMNFGSAVSNSAGSAVAISRQAKEEFSSRLENSFSKATQGSDQSSITDTIREGWQTSSSELETLSMNAARTITKGMGLNEDQVSTAAAQLALGVSGSAGFAALGNGLTLNGKGELARGASESASVKEQLQSNFAREFGDGSQLSTQMQNAVSADLATGKTESLSTVLGETETESLAKSAAYAEAKSAQAQEARTLANQFGASQSVSPLAISQNLVTSHQGAYDELKSMAVQEGIYADAGDRATRYVDQYGGIEKARAGSIVQGLFEKFRDNNDMDGMQHLLATISPVIGRAEHSLQGPDMDVSQDVKQRVSAGNLAEVRDEVIDENQTRGMVHTAFRDELGEGKEYVKERNLGNLGSHDVQQHNRQIDASTAIEEQEQRITEGYQEKKHTGLQAAASVAGVGGSDFQNAARAVGDEAKSMLSGNEDVDGGASGESGPGARAKARHGLRSPS